jgi:hypothetical protein
MKPKVFSTFEQMLDASFDNKLLRKIEEDFRWQNDPLRIKARFLDKISLNLFPNVLYKAHDFLRNNHVYMICRGTEGPCFRRGKTRRRNTAYNDDKMNFVCQCDKCFEREEEHWDKMWENYYSERY